MSRIYLTALLWPCDRPGVDPVRPSSSLVLFENNPISSHCRRQHLVGTMNSVRGWNCEHRARPQIPRYITAPESASHGIWSPTRAFAALQFRSPRFHPFGHPRWGSESLNRFGVPGEELRQPNAGPKAFLWIVRPAEDPRGMSRHQHQGSWMVAAVSQHISHASIDRRCFCIVSVAHNQRRDLCHGRQLQHGPPAGLPKMGRRVDKDRGQRDRFRTRRPRVLHP
mmetsp:Transcript_28680/g.61537  ORF Transcript_28680/g.61537 Transcript_28680/m.61537 type:complete len:224 (-) Transcript_28680:823-1494(-)